MKVSYRYRVTGHDAHRHMIDVAKILNAMDHRIRKNNCKGNKVNCLPLSLKTLID